MEMVQPCHPSWTRGQQGPPPLPAVCHPGSSVPPAPRVLWTGVSENQPGWRVVFIPVPTNILKRHFFFSRTLDLPQMNCSSLGTGRSPLEPHGVHTQTRRDGAGWGPGPHGLWRVAAPPLGNSALLSSPFLKKDSTCFPRHVCVCVSKLPPVLPHLTPEGALGACPDSGGSGLWA